MKILSGLDGCEQAIIELVTATFAASEGADEGALIGEVVRDLLADTAQTDIHVFRAEIEGHVVGVAIITRLTYPDDPRHVVLLSPMAVATGHQRQGIGQAQLVHALAALRSERAEVALTYGDPDYYRQVGFAPITEDQARAPLPLSFPHGWLGQSLTEDVMPTIRGSSVCASALNRVDVW
ncbi:GNAT family N-acetyltransferase [Histidinibacterium aquaticum]|uniref:N-acetyltransferase n=1 Tax=Histidinibacterium aquaticum TaxID=2613962 RepID=A0A5J5GAQ9_9RHOB|nr:GNAT family N-acetyltransferase [Histidinibacterium aquaticum]KAA9004993.1 N-acetyltransferase [Histidinibacterium aquaticum]